MADSYEKWRSAPLPTNEEINDAIVEVVTAVQNEVRATEKPRSGAALYRIRDLFSKLQDAFVDLSDQLLRIRAVLSFTDRDVRLIEAAADQSRALTARGVKLVVDTTEAPGSEYDALADRLRNAVRASQGQRHA